MASDRPTIFDGEQTRPMDDAEYAQWQADQAAPAPDPTPPPTPEEVASQMAETIHSAVVAVPDTADVSTLRDAITSALTPYLPAS